MSFWRLQTCVFSGSHTRSAKGLKSFFCVGSLWVFSISKERTVRQSENDSQRKGKPETVNFTNLVLLVALKQKKENLTWYEQVKNPSGWYPGEIESTQWDAFNVFTFEHLHDLKTKCILK